MKVCSNLAVGAVVLLLSSAPKASAQCIDFVVTLEDSWGDGWNGNVLWIGDNSLTIDDGNSSTSTVCLADGTYTPYACGGSFDSEVSWTVGGLSGGADDTCVGTAGSFVVASPTPSPTLTPQPTPFYSVVCTFDDNSLCTFQTESTHPWSGPRSGSTPSSSTGPTEDHTTGSGSYMFIEASTPNYPSVGPFYLSTDLTMDASAGSAGAGAISFAYSMYGATCGELSVEVQSYGAWKTHWAKSGEQGSGWLTATVVVGDPYATAIRFAATTGTSYTGDIAIDDIYVSTSTMSPTLLPTITTFPTISAVPTVIPSLPPTLEPSALPTSAPSLLPSQVPTASPSMTSLPTFLPSLPPTLEPSALPSSAPSLSPYPVPTASPSIAPTSGDAVSIEVSLDLIANDAPTDDQSTVLKRTLASSLGIEEANMKSFSVTASADNGGRRRRFLLSVTWKVSFKVVISMAASGASTANDLASSISTTLSSAAFESSIKADVETSLLVDTPSVAAVAITRSPSPLPSSAPTPVPSLSFLPSPCPSPAPTVATVHVSTYSELYTATSSFDDGAVVWVMNDFDLSACITISSISSLTIKSHPEEFHSLDASSASHGHFYISSYTEVAFENLRLRNGYGAIYVTDYGSVSVLNVTFESISTEPALWVYAGSFSLDNVLVRFCTFKDCAATSSYGGGAIMLTGGSYGGTAIIEDSKFEHCTASDGGAIYVYGPNSTLSVVRSSFVECEATAGSSTGYGGAVLGNDALHLAFSDCYFEKNKALTSGGAIQFGYFGTTLGSISVYNSTFVENESPLGGAVAVLCSSDTETVFSSSVFKQNYASLYNNTGGDDGSSIDADIGGKGGDMFLVYGITRVTDCQFFGSSAASMGAAVYSISDSLSIYRCSFESSSSPFGGALVLLSGENTISASTFQDLTASSLGGALYVPVSPPVYAEENEDAVTTLGISGCTFFRCSASSGGGAYIEAGVEVNVQASNFTLCNASKSGGAIFAESLRLSTIAASTFSLCLAEFSGGGVAVRDGAVSVNDCSFFSCSVTVAQVTSVCLKLIMTDIFGDGWNGGYLYVMSLQQFVELKKAGLDLTTTLDLDDDVSISYGSWDAFIDDDYTIDKDSTSTFDTIITSLWSGTADSEDLCFDVSDGEDYVVVTTADPYPYEGAWKITSADESEAVIDNGAFARVYALSPFQPFDTCAGSGGGALHFSGSAKGSVANSTFTDCSATNANGGSIVVVSDTPLATDLTTVSVADSSFGPSTSNYYGSIMFSTLSTVAMTNVEVVAKDAGLSSLDGIFFNQGGETTCRSSCSSGYFGNCTAVDGCFSCSPFECHPCSAGTYLSSAGAVSSAACLACEEGTVSVEGAAACSSCPVATYASDSPFDIDGYGVTIQAMACAACPPGRYGDAPQATECSPCALGYSSFSNSTACFICNAGSFARVLASPQCTECALGTYQASVGATSCDSCGAGYVQDQAGQMSCEACSVGWYQATTGQSQCVACIAGTYNSDQGGSTCADCPGDLYSNVGSSNCTQCLKGFYFTEIASEAGECLACPDGTLCNRNGASTQTKLQLRPGYWRVSEHSVEIERCPYPGGCIGDNESLAAASDEEFFGDAYCAAGFEGPLCAICVEGYYLDVDAATCTLCPVGAGQSLSRMAASSAMLVVLGVTFALLLFTCFKKLSATDAAQQLSAQAKVWAAKFEKLKEQLEQDYDNFTVNDDGTVSFAKANDEKSPYSLSKPQVKTQVFHTPFAKITTTSVVVHAPTRTSTSLTTVIAPSSQFLLLATAVSKLQSKVKALTAFSQIAVNVGFNCNLEFPPLYEKFMSSFSIVNLDIVPSLGLPCQFSYFDYIYSMCLTTLFPIFVSVLLGLAYVLIKAITKIKTQEARDAGQKVMNEKYIVPQEFLAVFTEKEIKKFKRTFLFVDADRGGSIGSAELSAVIKRFSPEIMLDEVDRMVTDMIKEVSTDRDDEIDFGEFLVMMMRARREGRTSQFSEIADQVDALVNKKAGQSIVNAFLVLSFLVLISTSITIFHYLKCHKFVIPEEDGGGDLAYLFRDYSIDCHSARYKLFVPYALSMILVYPLGIPGIYFVLLWSKRSTLSDPIAMEREIANGFPTVGHLTFLVRAYTPDLYFFEVVECFRRLMLAAMIGIASADSAVSPILGLLICGVFTYLFVELKPYKEREDSDLSIVLAYSLALIFLAAILLKVDVGGDDPDDQKVFGVMLIVIVLAGPIAIAYQATTSAVRSSRAAKVQLAKKKVEKKRLKTAIRSSIVVAALNAKKKYMEGFSKEEVGLIQKKYSAVALVTGRSDLSQEEFKELVSNLISLTVEDPSKVPSDKDLDAAFIIADEDKSGSVDEAEFCALYRIAKRGEFKGLGQSSFLKRSSIKQDQFRRTMLSEKLVDGDGLAVALHTHQNSTSEALQSQRNTGSDENKEAREGFAWSVPSTLLPSAVEIELTSIAPRTVNLDDFLKDDGASSLAPATISAAVERDPSAVEESTLESPSLSLKEKRTHFFGNASAFPPPGSPSTKIRLESDEGFRSERQLRSEEQVATRELSSIGQGKEASSAMPQSKLSKRLALLESKRAEERFDSYRATSLVTLENPVEEEDVWQSLFGVPSPFEEIINKLRGPKDAQDPSVAKVAFEQSIEAFHKQAQQEAAESLEKLYSFLKEAGLASKYDKFVDYGVESVLDILNPLLINNVALKSDIGLSDIEIASFNKHIKLAQSVYLAI